jgi:hypothetical protein
MPLALWLLDESALTQISEWVIGEHRRQSCDTPAAHRHDDLAAGCSVANVAAELVVQLTHADLTLERLLMWRHEAQCRRHIGPAQIPVAPWTRSFSTESWIRSTLGLAGRYGPV